jgi:hypothetical protein
MVPTADADTAETTMDRVKTAMDRGENNKAGDGIRTHDVQLGKLVNLPQKARKSSDSENCAPTGAPSDPDFAKVAAAWPTLPDAIRRAIMALVGTVD